MKLADLFIESFNEIKNNFQKYSYFYFMLLFLTILDSSSELFIPKYAENINVFFSLIIFFLMLAVTVLFLKTLKVDSKKGDFWYLFIPYLLYTIYYSIVMLLGFALLFIPGIIFFYAPILATFGSGEVSPFKRSIQMVRKNWGIAIFLSVTSLLLELMPLSFKLIQNTILRLLVDGVFSIFDCFLYLLIAVMTVRIYYLEIPPENL